MQDQLIQYLTELVNINSVNPDLSSEGQEEREIAEYVFKHFDQSIGISNKGYAWFEIEIEGLAAHGSRPEQGINAIFPLAAALHELELINQELAQEKPDPYLGHATLHPGLISGGTGQSVIAAMSKLNWERRILPAHSVDEWVSLASLVNCYESMKRFILDFD